LLKFALDHPNDWCGVKLIYGPSRGSVLPDNVTNLMQKAALLASELSNVFVGFDLAGQEDRGRPLFELAREIIAGLELYPNLKVFFHAAETDWQGQPSGKRNNSNQILKNHFY